MAKPERALGAKEKQKIKEANAAEANQKKLEDETWQDDDKNLARKNKRKEEEEQKRLDAARRKQEAKDMLESEEAVSPTLTKGGKIAPPKKLTVFQIELQKLKLAQEAKAKRDEEERIKKIYIDEQLLVDSTMRENNIADSKLRSEGHIIAQGLDKAIEQFTLDEAVPAGGNPVGGVNRKTLYADFEAKRLPELKEENPNLKISQYKERLTKEWRRHPNNPNNPDRL